MIRFPRIAAATTLALSVGAGAAAEEGPSVDTVLATVNGVEITVGHLIVSHQSLPEQFRQLPPETLFDPLLEQLIEQTALMMQGSEDDLTTAERVALENDRRAVIANSVLTRATEGAVTDESLATAYEAFVAEFEAEGPVPEFNASHIIVETEAEAQALREELDAGADFADLAREHSTDGAAVGGGSLGWFGPGVMIPEFESAVMAMEPGDIEGPLETQFGWHLVRLNDTRVSTAPELDEVRTQLQESIQREAAVAEVARVLQGVEVSRNADAADPSVIGRMDLLDD